MAGLSSSKGKIMRWDTFQISGGKHNCLLLPVPISKFIHTETIAELSIYLLYCLRHFFWVGGCDAGSTKSICNKNHVLPPQSYFLGKMSTSHHPHSVSDQKKKCILVLSHNFGSKQWGDTPTYFSKLTSKECRKKIFFIFYLKNVYFGPTSAYI